MACQSLRLDLHTNLSMAGKRAAPGRAKTKARAKSKARAKCKAEMVDANDAAAPAALPAQLAGLNADYLSRLQVWLETIGENAILATAFVDDVQPLSVQDGAMVAPIIVPALKERLEARAGLPIKKHLLIWTGGVPFAWLNPLQSPVPGVQINEHDVDSFIKRDFKTDNLPEVLRSAAVALMDDDAVDNFGLVGRLQVVSSAEKLHAPIKHCASEITSGKMTDVRARQWWKLFMSIQIDVWRLNKNDLGTHAFSLREDKKDEASITTWTTLQKMQMVIRERLSS